MFVEVGGTCTEAGDSEHCFCAEWWHHEGGGGGGGGEEVKGPCASVRSDTRAQAGYPFGLSVRAERDAPV